MKIFSVYITIGSKKGKGKGKSRFRFEKSKRCRKQSFVTRFEALGPKKKITIPIKIHYDNKNFGFFFDDLSF